MEKATGLGRIPFRHCAAAAAGWCLLMPLWAQDAMQQPQDLLRTEARSEAPLQLEVNATALPRLDGQPGGFQAPRVDLAVVPASGSGLGVAVGMSSGFTAHRILLPSGHAARPGVDLGLTFRHTLANDKQIDITAWRRMQGEQDAFTLVQMREPLYGARVEMKLSSANKTGLAFERGFVGLQLEGGAKISIKRRHGGPMIYYRTKF